MRMWMVPVEGMCNKHLLGEHVEHHMFVGSIKKELSMEGYVRNNLMEPTALHERHDALVLAYPLKPWISVLSRHRKHLKILSSKSCNNCKDQMDLILLCGGCMKNHDELMGMTDDERMEYLHQEVEKVIASAPPHQVLKLRHLQARMDGIRNRVKNPQVSLMMIAREMMVSFHELRAVLLAMAERKDSGSDV